MSTDPFADLDDGAFDRELTGESAPTIDRAPTSAEPLDQRNSQNTVARYEEDCHKCGGRGKFISYTGRVVGDCFACKGAGKMLYKTPRSAREKAREQAKARKAKQAGQRVDAFKSAHPELFDWMVGATWNTFAQDVLGKIEKYEPTENQIAALYRSKAKANARDAERAEKAAAREAAAPQTAGLIKLVAGFNAASEHLKRPRLAIGDLKFSKAPEHGANAGHLYVKADETYLGKVTPEGKFLAGRDCTPELLAAITAIGEDPFAEAVAHGHATGVCSCCSRKLTNPESVELGIGPICRERWGW